MNKKLITISLIVNFIFIWVAALYIVWSLNVFKNIEENQQDMVREEVLSFLKSFDVEVIE